MSSIFRKLQLIVQWSLEYILGYGSLREALGGSQGICARAKHGAHGAPFEQLIKEQAQIGTAQKS